MLRVPCLIADEYFLLVGVKDDGVDRRLGLIDPLTLQVPHPEVPDTDTAILTTWWQNNEVQISLGMTYGPNIPVVQKLSRQQCSASKGSASKCSTTQGR